MSQFSLSATSGVPSEQVDTTWHSNSARDFYENGEIRALRCRLTEYAMAGVPVHLSGLPGLGKTALAYQVALALGRPVSMMTGNARLELKDFIGGAVGTKISTVVDQYVQSVKKTEHVYRADWGTSVLAEAMNSGHTLIYDEFTRATPETNAALLSVLEEGVLRSTDPSCPVPFVRAHNDFRIILVSNPLDELHSKMRLSALLDRVVTVKMAKFSNDTLAWIVHRKTNLELKTCTALIQIIFDRIKKIEKSEYSILRAAILVARIVVYRKTQSVVNENDLLELTSEVLSGREYNQSSEPPPNENQQEFAA